LHTSPIQPSFIRQFTLSPRSGAPVGNFGFLSEHDPLLLRLCVGAERNYHEDPNTTVIKLRQFGEAVVK
jgi:hypothetical protein